MLKFALLDRSESFDLQGLTPLQLLVPMQLILQG